MLNQAHTARMSDLPSPAATDRLFFALRPDANAASHIGPVADALRTAHGLRAPVLAAPRWHVTLCFLGDFAGVPPGVLDASIRAGAGLDGAGAFDVVFDRAGSFEGRRSRRPLVLRGGDEALSTLAAFRARLAAALADAGVPFDDRPYVPHLTLLYDTTAVADQPVAPVTWRADAFELVRSRIGHGVHDVLGRWSLL